MPFSSFQEFTAAICARLDIEPPVLQPDADGTVGFTLTHEGTQVSLAESRYGELPSTLMLVEFGAVPSQQEHAALLGLMDANFMMMGMDTPTFARNPATGCIVMTRSLLLSQADIDAVLDSLSGVKEAMRMWQGGYFLDDPQPMAASEQHLATTLGFA